MVEENLVLGIGMLAVVVGSPALGYVVWRAVIAGAMELKPWQQWLFSIVVGAGWIGLLGIILQPLFGASSDSFLLVQALGEFFAWAGMGLILITFAVGIISHGIRWTIHRESFSNSVVNPIEDDSFSQKMNAFPSTVMKGHKENKENSMRDFDVETAESISSVKPIKVRTGLGSKQGSDSFGNEWEPSTEEGLKALKEELAQTPVNASKSKSSATKTTRREPSSLEKQLAQLKKDIKAFNTSATSGHVA